MLIPERRRLVVDHVRRFGSASIDELADSLSVSPSTIRRDLDRLHEQGLLARTHGGAVRSEALGRSRADSAREVAQAQRADAKHRIAALAAGLVEDDSTIMVLAGSTTSAIVPHLLDRRLTVVTNGLEVAFALRHAPDISLVVLGGVLHTEQMTLIGPMAMSAMSALNVQLMIAGAWGVDAVAGVTGNKIIQAGQHEAMLAYAERLIVLADESKLGRRGPTRLARVDQVDTVITESTADARSLSALRESGVRVLTA